jgi:hypothetical protein
MKLAYIVEESNESVRKLGSLFVVEMPEKATCKVPYFHESDLLYRTEDSESNSIMVFAQHSLKKANRSSLIDLLYNAA